MTATYFRNRQSGHSYRGESARERGARAWSKLPASLRQGLTTKEAAAFQISPEWHHAGKYASRVYVYYPSAVQVFWESIEEAGYTAKDLKANAAAYELRVFGGFDDVELAQAIHAATRLAWAKAEEFDYDRDELLD